MDKSSMEELGKRIIAGTKKFYRKGMTKEEFAKELFPGMQTKDAPQWIHDLVNALWDYFFNR